MVGAFVLFLIPSAEKLSQAAELEGPGICLGHILFGGGLSLAASVSETGLVWWAHW